VGAKFKIVDTGTNEGSESNRSFHLRCSFIPRLGEYDIIRHGSQQSLWRRFTL